MKSISIIKSARFLRIGCLIFFCWCALFPTWRASTQQKVDPPCTVLELHCPTYVVSGAGRITFQGHVVGAKEILGDEETKLLAYEWEVSGGKIISGQGTPTIIVEATDAQANFVTVTEKVKGVPPTCEYKKSCTLKVDSKCAIPQRFDNYRDLSFKDEKSHLDNLAKSLLGSGQDLVVYILAYAGRNACIGEADWRAGRAKQYLIEKHRIQDERIILVDGGFRDDVVIELFLLPRNSCGPLPTPTVATSDAKIRGLCSDKYKQIANP